MFPKFCPVELVKHPDEHPVSVIVTKFVVELYVALLPNVPDPYAHCDVPSPYPFHEFAENIGSYPP
jgi:hypothetical protein